jgi:alkaline phosphatase
MRFSILLFVVAILTFGCGGGAISELPLAEPGAEPTNVILLIGDGMGLSHVTATVYDQGEKSMFPFFPVIGLQKTYSASDLITDSGAGATAMACGVKTYNNAIGVDADTLPATSLIELAEAHGYSTGIVATASIVHATPASFFAHHPMRVQYEAIAPDLPESGLDFFIGGGQKFFNRREDDRDLVSELQREGFIIRDYFHEELTASMVKPSKKFGYFTADNNPVSALMGRDYLPSATRIATHYLENQESEGFFLLVEGSQIDWASHSNLDDQLLYELQDFNRAIREALLFYQKHPETLIIVTADHETGGLAINPGSTPKKLELAFTTNGHTATMVPVFAIGPGAERFNGIYENTEIHHRIVELLGWKSVEE